MDLSWTKLLVDVATGGLVGYGTNWLAIKMLFRPKRHIPGTGRLTPGVFIQNQAELARNMGELVARRLLTPESLQRQVTSPQFRRFVREFTSASVARIVGRDYGSIRTLVPERGKSDLSELEAQVGGFLVAEIRRLVETRSGHILEAVDEQLERLAQLPLHELLPPHLLDTVTRFGRRQLVGFLGSERFRKSLAGFFHQEMALLENMPVSDFITPALFEAMSGFAGRLLDTHLYSREFQERVAEFGREKLDDFLRTERPLADYFPAEARALFFRQFVDLVPALLEVLRQTLSDRMLLGTIKGAVQQAVDETFEDWKNEGTPSSQMVKIFADLIFDIKSRIKRSTDRKLEPLVSHFFESLGEPGTRQALADLLARIIGELLAIPPRDLFRNADEESCDRLVRFLTESLFQALKSPDVRAVLRAFNRELFGRLARQPLTALIPDRTLRLDLYEHLFQALLSQADSATSLRLFVREAQGLLNHYQEQPLDFFLSRSRRRTLLVLAANATRDFLRSEEGGEMLAASVGRLLKGLLDRPLGRPLHYLSPEIVEAATDFTGDFLQAKIEANFTSIVDELNIDKIVEMEVKRFRPEDVEQMILEASNNQLRTITILGLYLGMLIGLLGHFAKIWW